MNEVKKICTKCKIEKKVSLFYTQKTGRDGYRASCKECDFAKQKTYPRYNSYGKLTEEEKEKKRKYNTEWAKNKRRENGIIAKQIMTPEQAAMRKLYMHKVYVENNPETIKRINAKYRKNDKNLNAKIALTRLGIKYKDVKNYPELIELKRLQLEGLHEAENLIKIEKNGSQRIA